MILTDLFESHHACPECGGPAFSDLILAEKKDACYYKVKASAKVWPSAYASGRLVQCRKKGADNYGKSKNEGVAEGAKEDMSKEAKAMASGKCPHCHGPVEKKEHPTLTQYHCAKCGIRASIDKQGVAEGFPHDVDHMPGPVIRNADMTTDNVKTKDKAEWDRATDSINARVFDDMSEFRTDSKGETVVGDSAVWAKWDNATQTGWFNTKGRPLKPWPVKEQGVAEDQLDELKCWPGHHRVPGTKAGFPGSCAKNKTNEDSSQDCPPATQDIKLNLKNRQKAIDEYGYGPLNPDMPNRKFWMAKQAEWKLDSPEEAKQSLCGNCAAFDQRTNTLDCIAQGIGSDQGADDPTIDAGDLGYCRFLKFKCASRRTCDAWVTGGPLVDKPAMAEDQLAEKSVSQAQFRTMAAAAHNPKFAKKVGISPAVAKEFHSADKDSNYKKLPDRTTEGEVEKTKTGMIHRSSGAYGGGEAPRAPYDPGKYAKDIDHLDKGLTAKLDKSMGIKWPHGNKKSGMDEGEQQKGADYRDPPEADYGDDYQDMVARVKKLAGLGPLKTVYDPQKRVYRNVPTAVQPKK